nr:uncharacterized protein LOC106681841 [Halyomorpha halys]
MHRLIFLWIVGLLHSSSAQTSSSTSTTPSSPSAIGGSASGCLAYNAACSNSNTCCYYPSILCLPDARNGTSCLSIFDVVNLSPTVTGTNIVGSLTSAIGNSTSGIGAIQEVVEVNGNTVYNLTEIITPTPTPGVGSTPPSLG